MGRTVYELQQQRQLLGRQVADNLEFLMGSISTKGPKRPGHNLTQKVNGVTRTRHIRVQDLDKVRVMIARHKTLKQLIRKIADLNWEILIRQSE
jgi:hypothetical protein